MTADRKRVFETGKKVCKVPGHGEYVEKVAVSRKGDTFRSFCPECEKELARFLNDPSLMEKVKIRRVICKVEGHGEYLERSVSPEGGDVITSTCSKCAAEIKRREPRIKVCPNNPDHGEYAAEYMAYVQQKAIYSTCPACEAERRSKEENVEAYHRTEEIRRKAKACDIPDRFKESEFENYAVENDGQGMAHYLTSFYVEQFLRKGKGEYNLILYGEYGTGKTHLACAIAKKLIRAGFSVKYTSVLKVTGEVKGTFRKDSSLSPNDIFTKYASFDLIILDEVGVGQKNTEWEHGVLYDLINRRYEKKLPTIVISNLPEDTPEGSDPEQVINQHLERHLTKKVVDRLRENCGEYVYFDWQSYRRKTYKN